MSVCVCVCVCCCRYTHLSSEATVHGLLVNGQPVQHVTAGGQVEVLLDNTPFYAESGENHTHTHTHIHTSPSLGSSPTHNHITKNTNAYCTGRSVLGYHYVCVCVCVCACVCVCVCVCLCMIHAYMDRVSKSAKRLCVCASAHRWSDRRQWCAPGRIRSLSAGHTGDCTAGQQCA